MYGYYNIIIYILIISCPPAAGVYTNNIISSQDHDAPGSAAGGTGAGPAVSYVS